MAYQARHPYRPLGATASVTALAAPFNAATWARDQATRWQSSGIRGKVDVARSAAAQLNVSLPALNVPLNEAETQQFVTGYAAKFGVPTSLEQVQAMTQNYIGKQAGRMGVTPEMMAAGNLILHPPTTIEDGVKWTGQVAKGYAEDMGIPMTSEGLVKAGAGMASAQLGVDPAIIDTGIGMLKDGKVDSTDLANIAVAAATYACASLGQAIGIPAPIGAMIGSLVSKTIVGVIVKIAGPQERDVMDAAWKKAEKARAARKAECAAAGKEAWVAYVMFWEETLGRLQTVLNQPEIGGPLVAAGGVRYFHRDRPPAKPAVNGVFPPDDPRDRRPSCIVTNPSAGPNAWKPRPAGCVYYPDVILTGGADWYKLTKFQQDIRLAYQAAQMSAGQREIHAGPMTFRSNYRDYTAPFIMQTVQVTSGGQVNEIFDARAMLKFWGVEELRTFGPNLGQASDAASVKYASTVPQQWIGAKGRIIPQGDCIVPDEVAYLQANMQDAALAASEVMQDIMQTVAWQLATAAIEQTKREAQEKAAAAVQARGDLQRLAALSPAQRQQLVDMQKLAALSPEQQRQLVEYARAAAPSPAQQRQLADLQKLAALTPAEQRQLVEYAKAAEAAKPVEQQPLILAVAAKQNAEAVQAKIRQAGASRRLRLTVAGALIVVGGAWVVTRRKRKS